MRDGLGRRHKKDRYEGTAPCWLEDDDNDDDEEEEEEEEEKEVLMRQPLCTPELPRLRHG